jgi:hypothetical protein
VAPWGARLIAAVDGPPTRSAPDDRDAVALAAEITAAAPEMDPHGELAASLALAGAFGVPAPGSRERWWAGGPVPSNRFP